MVLDQMHRLLSACCVLGLLVASAPTTAWAELGSPEESVRTHVIDFGVLRAGERRCQPTGLSPGSIVHHWPEPNFPRGVETWGSSYSSQFCLEAGLWAPPCGPREVDVDISLDYFRSGRARTFRQHVHGMIRLEVRRTLGVMHFASVLWFSLLVLLVAVVVWRRRPGFERNLHLAYRIETEAGYRSPGQTEWRYVTVESHPGGRRSFFQKQSIALEKALDPEASIKPVLLEPFPDDEVMVRASMPMLVQAIGEPTARTATNEVTISPGMVVRAGRVLFALLTPELLDSVREGRVELPTPGSGGEEGRESVLDGLRARLSRRQPGLWGWLLLAFGPAAAGLLFGLSGLITNGFFEFISITVVMILTLAQLQQIRSPLGARSSRTVPDSGVEKGS